MAQLVKPVTGTKARVKGMQVVNSGMSCEV